MNQAVLAIFLWLLLVFGFDSPSGEHSAIDGTRPVNEHPLVIQVPLGLLVTLYTLGTLKTACE